MSKRDKDPLDAGDSTCRFCAKRLNQSSALERFCEHAACLVILTEESIWAEKFAADPKMRTAVG
jgi:hypothetical protein